MKIQENQSLAPLTSFGVGGVAERLVIVESTEEISQSLPPVNEEKTWYLGYGTNVLISDNGLPGTTILLRNKETRWQDNMVVAGAGVWWDDLVQETIGRNLWGLEFTSGIPGSVGAAVFINITAYGQSQSDRLVWVEYLDSNRQIQRLNAREQTWDYKKSLFQEHPDWLITQAAYELLESTGQDLAYQSALDVAKELSLDTNNLNDRRKIILEARERAGSIFIPGQNYAKTVGSFFRNPIVTSEQANQVIQFDESGKSAQQIRAMNQVHGGNQMRVSAAHVMLAAGFSRGQIFGNVRLHPNNLLKIENLGNASAQEIYDVAQEIMQTVKNRLGIVLEPEAQILGDFN